MPEGSGSNNNKKHSKTVTQGGGISINEGTQQSYYYAVTQGHTPGMYGDWSTAKKQTDHLP